MTKTNMDLSELLSKHDQGDFLSTIAEAVLQLIMETGVEGLIGAGRHERSGERTTWRNGYRDRTLDTRLGTLNLRVPKLRQGSYFPGFLEAGRRQSKPWSPSSRKPGSGASRPGAWTIWCRQWGSAASPRARCPSSART